CDCHGNEVPGPAVPYKVGIQTRECNATSGEWGPWGMCSIGECQEPTCSWQEGTAEAFLQYSVGATCDTCERQLGQETCGACTKATEGNTCPSQVSACEPGCLDHQDRVTPRAWNVCVADGGTPICISVTHTPLCVCTTSDMGSRP
ncbi:MAG: hypothetical protein MJ053_05525, partial [Elusimicrobiaceae bacterium]|nr:hypothetical protein [Elusimicrobiaceae bacterium]